MHTASLVFFVASAANDVRMGSVAAFLWGTFGSIAVELVMVSKYYCRGRMKLPLRYHRLCFYIVRLLVAIVGGGLAVAYGINNPVLAVHIGAATPVIVQGMSQTLPPVTTRPGPQEAGT